ncbi:hypothetical protein K2173_003823 [Erythroxylum novogranatense]|uniref:Protein kinase domain-containing protein n=1 Tax=Erythroxylum novogranatense TaxID=1862640 RepID=A0AAV8SJ15_9ROSI|nr:hypothetical protein K2173_003823 [Erythroxylum novogranatense]
MHLLPIQLIPTFLLLFVNFSLSLNNDGLALLALKAAVTSDPTQALSSWSDSDPSPCHWHGVICSDRRVTSLFLPNKTLTGYIPSELGLLNYLTRLSLSHNNFSKTIPLHLFKATNLRSLDLSHNSLSGLVPPQISSLQALTHLDLSSNSFNGSLPLSLIQLKSLTGTLNLSYNAFSGGIPESYGDLPVVVSLDLRNNNLSGKVPLAGSLVNQGPTAFAGNPGLCGFPLQAPCPEAANTTASDNPQNPDSPRDPIPSTVGGKHEGKAKNGSVAVPLISVLSVIIGAVSLSAWLFRRRWKNDEKRKRTGKEEKIESRHEATEEGQQGKFVVMDEGFSLELEELLRASAHVVGKSRSGIVYKVVVGGRGSGAVVPTVVAVRRLSEGDHVAACRFKDFVTEVEAIGRVHHPNIVRLKAYHYSDDEKLLVSDFVRNGSLYSALHGEPSNALTQLPWATRLKIAQGAARGLMYIHEYSPRKYVHGNLKSTKILLDDELHPYISGFGLSRLFSSSTKLTTSVSKRQNANQTIVASTMGLTISAPSNFYLAPEARVSGCKFTQKCDVYSFGIILMELLTGRLPDDGSENDGKGLESLVRKVFRDERPLSQIIDRALLSEVHAKKQVLAMFHIALNCTEIDPEMRPRMKTVSESLDRINLQ